MAEVPTTWSIVGAGNVGGAVMEMAAKPEVAARNGLRPQPDLVLRSDGWHQYGKDGPLVEAAADVLPDSDVLFVAIPSVEGHEPALSLMREQLGRGRMVVTAEKGILAEHVPELMDLPGQLGYWAAYGGGTRLIDKMKLDTIDPQNIRELYKNPNGTLSYALGLIAVGHDPGEVASSAVREGLAEPVDPGTRPSIADIFRSEAIDVARKEVVALKMTLPGFEGLSLTDLETELSDDDIERVLAEPGTYRYLTANFHEDAADLAAHMTRDRLGGFDLRYGGFIVCGGFMRLDQQHPDYRSTFNNSHVLRRPLELFAAVPGPTAAYYIHHKGSGDTSTEDGWSFTIGSGAGADTTANAMLDNYRHLKAQSTAVLPAAA